MHLVTAGALRPVIDLLECTDDKALVDNVREVSKNAHEAKCGQDRYRCKISLNNVFYCDLIYAIDKHSLFCCIMISSLCS